MKITGKMRKNLKQWNVLTFLILAGYMFAESKAPLDVFPPLTLKGDDGGLCGGKEWKSSSLKDKVNLVIYVDPDKQDWVKPLVVKLDSINYSPDSLGVTFILNTEATIIPDFIIRNRVQDKAKTSPNITYVLDQEKVLVRKWNLVDNDINVLLMNASGKIIRKHNGKMTRKFINQFIKKIDESIKEGDAK